MDIMKIMRLVAFTLVVVGAINWGLVGAAHVNLVDMILGTGTLAAKIVYMLVGLSGVFMLISMGKCMCTSCKKCD